MPACVQQLKYRSAFSIVATIILDMVDDMDSQYAIIAGDIQNPPSKSIPIPCRHYARGSCLRGEACLFVHEGPGASISVTPGLEANPKVPCRFFARGNCTRHPCPFAHKPSPKPSAPAAPLPVAQEPILAPQSQLRCRFFVKGRCRNGDTCPFAHSDGDATDGLDEKAPDEMLLHVRWPMVFLNLYLTCWSTGGRKVPRRLDPRARRRVGQV